MGGLTMKSELDKLANSLRLLTEENYVLYYRNEQRAYDLLIKNKSGGLCSGDYTIEGLSCNEMYYYMTGVIRVLTTN